MGESDLAHRRIRQGRKKDLRELLLCFFIAVNVFRAGKPLLIHHDTHARRLGIGERHESHLPPRIFQNDRMHTIQRPEDVEPLMRQETARHREALRAVMVPADDDQRDMSLPYDFLCHAVKELHRLLRRVRTVIDIPREQDDIRPLFIDKRKEPVHQKPLLILRHGMLFQKLSQMPVSRMDKFHGTSSYEPLRNTDLSLL